MIQISAIFTKSPSFEGKVTRFLTRGDFDHCAIVTPWNPGHCIDASYGDPVQYRTIDKLIADRPGSRVASWEIEDYDAFKEFLERQVGKQYDKWGRWTCVLPFDFASKEPDGHIIEVTGSRTLNPEGEWFCSRLLMNALEYGRYKGLRPSRPEYSASPQVVLDTSVMPYQTAA